MFFKKWQIETLNVLWHSEEGLLSSAVYKQVNEKLPGTISRASIINGLNAMVNLGILTGVDETGKGGHRSRYSPAINEREVKDYLSDIVRKKFARMSRS
jgi:Fe2+ or Zn2+ uptake regulation protein